MNATFPARPTAFIGREAELATITQSLHDPTCRLLTLIGPGGVGKTRLAIEAARTVSGDFERGAFFVNLKPIEHANRLASSIAESIGFSLSGQAEPQIQLFNYLADKEMFLVLDNFETLLAGTEFVAQLLQNMPIIKLIVTSRQALNLREEWLYPLGSMPYPAEDTQKKDKIPTAVWR